ncbi:hypothetical protein Anas_00091 [Armadillidium nasatum]|uniref:Retinol dehydrogenase 14 n=1 Tax=Armadillidium nasatum TaxID=96803 RepID=A0A5N5SVQ0_9CRUS|nr:hypothetical protein Anas_00091 [Armadillidium nasatum]
MHFKNRTYKFMKSYSQSKLCNVLFTNELARLLDQKGIKNVTVNSLHPGAVKTEIVKNSGILWMEIIAIISKFVYKSAKLGAQTTNPFGCFGRRREKSQEEYFVDCKIAPTSDLAKNENLARKVWQISEKEVGLTEKEKYF